MMQIQPYKHGDWCVVDQQWIDVSTKDSEGQGIILRKELKVFIGSLNECEYFIRQQNNIVDNKSDYMTGLGG